jgi:hypothetical protein
MSKKTKRKIDAALKAKTTRAEPTNVARTVRLTFVEAVERSRRPLGRSSIGIGSDRQRRYFCPSWAQADGI